MSTFKLDPAVPMQPAAPTRLASPSRETDAGDAEAFSRLLAREVPHAEPASPSAGTARASTGTSLGDTILHGLQQTGADLFGRWQEIVKSAPTANNPASISDLLRTQMQLSMLTMETELVTTAIRKSSSAVDQMVRMQ